MVRPTEGGRAGRQRGRTQGDMLVRSHHMKVKQAAWQVMAQAYLEASGGGRLPAKGRQVYYRARGRILELTGRTKLDAQYFEQTLLPLYQLTHPDETASWDIVYDARGDLYEPHTGKTVPLGTLEVRGYLREISGHSVDAVAPVLLPHMRFPTCGPENRYGALVYSEKQGFDELFRAVRLSERYDIGILSAKGQSVVACRRLADELCGTYGIPLLVLHDFDLAGLNILHTLCNDTWRYQFKNKFEVIDLGLRLAESQEWGLESEVVAYGHKKNGEPKDPRDRLRTVGAAPEEASFLCAERDLNVGWTGRRVELNAFPSDKLVEWIEGKLQQYGVKKIVPGAATLEQAYRRAYQIEAAQSRVREIMDEAAKEAESARVPGNLAGTVRKRLKREPALPWDQVVAGEAARALRTNGNRKAGSTR